MVCRRPPRVPSFALHTAIERREGHEASNRSHRGRHLFTFGSASAVMAQDTDTVTEEATNDDGDTGLFGLIGLIGLAGLAGLKRRDRDDTYTRTRR